jgi:hypothetical protein
LISDLSDTYSVADLFSSVIVGATNNTTFVSTATDARYIFVITNKYFSQYTVQVGDRMLFQQFAGINALYPTSATEMATFMNRTEGHVVVGIANYDGSTINPGTNTVGYANVIVLEVRMNDPTTGSTAVNPFGGSANHNNYLNDSNTAWSGKLINLNRQTQFVFRVITRELDAATRLRPDNLN